MNLLTVSVALLLTACISLVLMVFFGIVKDNRKAFVGFALVAALCVAFVAVLLGQYQIPEVK